MNSNTNTPSTDTSEQAVVNNRVSQDLKNSILIVSIVVNLIVLTSWIALQVTGQFDSQIASFLFTR